MKQTITFIRRAVLALLMMMLTATTAWAGQVTEEQARQQAQNFLTNIGPTSGTRRASATTPQFTSTSQVSGLYVFNVDGGGSTTAPSPCSAIATRAASTPTTCLTTCVPGCKGMPTR